MARRGRAELGARVEKLRQRFEEWRRTRRSGTAIPASLWDGAAKLAKTHGINPVAQALRLDYYSLKERMGLVKERAGRKVARRAAFVELGVVEGSMAQQSVIELQHRDGAKMTIRLSSSKGLDVVELTSAFLRRRRR